MNFSKDDDFKVSEIINNCKRVEDIVEPRTELTEDQELILKGIRPKGMPRQQFIALRKILNLHIKKYLKGKVIKED